MSELLLSGIRQTRGRYITIISFLVLILASPVYSVPVYAQPYTARLEITGIDTSHYPAINVYTRLRGEEGGSILPIAEDTALFIFEDGEQRDLQEVNLVDAGSRMVLVLDSGDGVFNTGITPDEVRLKALAYFRLFISGRSWFQPGLDQVMVLIQNGGRTEILVPFTDQPQTVLTALENYSPGQLAAAPVPVSGKNSRIGLSAALEQLKQVGSGSFSQQMDIILFTPGYMADLGEISAIASASDVRIHAVMTREEASDYWSMYTRELAVATGGIFLPDVSESDPSLLFETIRAGAAQLCLTFLSTIPSTTHHLELMLQNEDISLQASGEYSIELLPPTVVVSAYSTGEQQKLGEEAHAGLASAQKGEQIVVQARVEFPDGFNQREAAAALYSEGILLDTAEVVGGNAVFYLNLSEAPESNGEPVSMNVVVEDEFGFTVVSNPAVFSMPESFSTGFLNQSLWKVFLILIVLTAGVAAVFVVMKGRKGGCGARIEDPVQESVDSVTNCMTQSVAAGFLIPLEGFFEQSRKAFELYGTTSLGRSRRYADLLIHQDEDGSPISRLHCTILENNAYFSVRDENSSNGTFLNEEQLIAFQAVRLKNGDILDLGVLERGGVRLMFQSAEGYLDEGYAEKDERKTRPQHDLPVLD
ncbi:MAG: FHA domain-containing protein [Anaerolineales bacterium]|nr:FHA domain-containing protein [Anaerolineales bacterium]